MGGVLQGQRCVRTGWTQGRTQSYGQWLQGRAAGVEPQGMYPSAEVRRWTVCPSWAWATLAWGLPWTTPACEAGLQSRFQPQHTRPLTLQAGTRTGCPGSPTTTAGTRRAPRWRPPTATGSTTSSVRSASGPSARSKVGGGPSPLPPPKKNVQNFGSFGCS